MHVSENIEMYRWCNKHNFFTYYNTLMHPVCVSYYRVSSLYNINTYFYVYFSLFICNINILVYFQKYHGQLKMVTKIQKL